MHKTIRLELWNQFGASIDMLGNAIRECPPELWDADPKFWYIAYHTLFFLDYYLTENAETFSPPDPFTLSEFDPDGQMPERVYGKNELLEYLDFCKEKCRKLLNGLTDDKDSQRFVNEYRNYGIFEILIYNLRHVQHHSGQLNLLLRMAGKDAPDWVSRTETQIE